MSWERKNNRENTKINTKNSRMRGSKVRSRLQIACKYPILPICRNSRLANNEDSVGSQGERGFSSPEIQSEAEGRCRSRDGTLFSNECRMTIRNLPLSSDLSWFRKKLYRRLEEGSVSDPLEKWLGWSKICSQWNWAPGSSFLNSEFSLTWRLARNALALNDWAYRACLADMPDCPRSGSGLEETALHAFYYCERVQPFWSHVEEWTARISAARRWLRHRQRCTSV